MIKKRLILLLAIILIISIISIYFIQKNYISSNLLVNNKTIFKGEIKICKNDFPDKCGNCYCIQLKDGCKIIDYKNLSILENYINRTIIVNGTTNQTLIKSTRMCPKYFKIYNIIN